MMTKSELQSLKDFLREEIWVQQNLVLGSKREAQHWYTQAIPEHIHGQVMFERLNSTRDALRYEKRKLTRLVALQKSVKKALKNDA